MNEYSGFWNIEIASKQASKEGTRRRKPCTFQIRLNRKKRWTGRPQTLDKEESETWVTQVASFSHIQLHDQIVLFQPLFLNLILRKIFWVISTPTGPYQASHIQQAQSLIARTNQLPKLDIYLSHNNCNSCVDVVVLVFQFHNDNFLLCTPISTALPHSVICLSLLPP